MKITTIYDIAIVVIWLTCTYSACHILPVVEGLGKYKRNLIVIQKWWNWATT